MVHRRQAVSNGKCCPSFSGLRLLIEHRCKALLRFLSRFAVVPKQIMPTLKHQAVNSCIRKRFGQWSLFTPLQGQRLLLEVESYVVLDSPNFPRSILLVITGPHRLLRLRTEQLCGHPNGLGASKTGAPNYEANL